nr:PREDICTED: odorant receptor 4-like [Linepithema humile]
MLSTGIMLIAYLQHACGMFKIASYRIEHVVQIHTLQDIIILPNENVVYKGIIRAIDIHRKAMMFSKYLIEQFEISFMFLIVFGVITLSLNIFRIFQIITVNYDIEEFFMAFVIVLIAILYMFLSNYIGQEIIDHNNHIFHTAYNVRWYMTPLSVQKLILLILQRGNKPFGLNVGGLFIASLHCFATLANASISYFTVMYSVR